MDKPIQKSKWNKTNIAYLVLGAALLILILFGFNVLNKKVYKLSEDKISSYQVERGSFQDVILIDASIEPIRSILVNNPDGGTVEEIYIEDGVFVEKGTPMLKLDNPAVSLGYMNQETAIIEQINNLRNLKLSLEKDQRILTESLLDIEYQVAKIERSYVVDTVLYQKGVLAKNDFIKSEAEYRYQLDKKAFLEDNVKKSKSDNKIQIQQIDRSINLMERNLEEIHKNIDKLLVKAPVSGLVSSFNPIIGTSISGMEIIAKIDVQEGFKIRGNVDEYYLSSVKPGQAARFSFDGELIELEVKKVLPEVVNNRFTIELIFIDSIPEAISNGMSLQARLELSKAREAVLIPRGSYFQSSGGQFVFVIDGDNEAHKRSIRIGRQNPSYYEVLEGLEPGERIITSSYEMYKNYEEIVINK
jgi:HlyD family secretion protein